MNIRTVTATFLTLLLSGLSAVLFAQQPESDALLPDIDPQDIEIRGEFQARFPGITRQPILGFDPSLRVYQIDPNRQPFMETGDDVVTNLPLSELSRPAPPQYNALEYNEDNNVYSRIGVGSFASPEAQFWGVLPTSETSYIGGDLDLSSSDDHLDQQRSSFRFLTANGEFGTRLDDKTELRLNGGLQSDFNFPAEFDANTSDEDGDRIEHEGFNAGVEIERFKNDVAGWKLRGDIRGFSTEFNVDQSNTKIDELVYGGSFGNRWALGSPNQTFTVKAGARGGNYEAGNQQNEQWTTLQGGIVYEQLFNYQTNLYAEADLFYITNIQQDQIYPGGLLKIDQWFGDRLKVTGKVEGKPHLNTVEQLHERNRFLGFDNDLIHTYSVDITGQAEIKYYRGSKIHGGVTYTNAQDYAFFLPNSQIIAPVDSPVIDVYSINYQNATNFKLFAGITHQLLPERFWVSGQAYLQNPELDSGEQIPFEENWGINASISFRPINRITLEGWADYTGERETNLSDDNTIDEFILVGAQLDVEITDAIGAYVKGVNLLDQEYQVWRGYEERPLQVYGGLTLKF